MLAIADIYQNYIIEIINDIPLYNYINFLNFIYYNIIILYLWSN